jgi:hypothetical protein
VGMTRSRSRRLRDRIAARPRLVALGAGAVALALVGMAAVVGGGTAAPVCADRAAQTAEASDAGVAGYSAEQLENARTIIDTAASLDLSARAQVIAVMTGLGESGLRNLDYGDEADGVTNPDGSITCSLGVFQQQWCLEGSPWGDRDQVLDPQHASESFFAALTAVDGWDRMSATGAAHQVQVNADPDHYARWEGEATQLVEAMTGVSCV